MMMCVYVGYSKSGDHDNGDDDDGGIDDDNGA